MAKNLKRRFNFVDVILIVIILSVAASLVYIFISPYTDQIVANASDTTIEYKILVEDVRSEIKYVINPNEKVTETNTLAGIGYVASYEERENEDSDTRDIIITVRASASNAKGRYSIGSYIIAAGKTISFRVPGFVATGSCIGVKEVG